MLSCLQVQRTAPLARLFADILTTADGLWLMEDYPSGELSRPLVHLLSLSGDFLKIISDSQWLMQTPLSIPDEGLSEATGTGSSQANREPSQADGGSFRTCRWRTEID